MMPKQNTTSSPTLAIQNLSLWNNINWLLSIAVVLTLLNGLFISIWIFPAVSGPVGLGTGPSDGWAEIAENIVRGNGFVYNPGAEPSATTGHLTREPVYALFLASILWVFGKLDPYMMLFQTLINSLTSFVLYFIVNKTFNRQAALIACFFYAFYPFASWYVPRIAYETLLGFLVTLLVLGLINLFEGLSFRRALTVGLLLGITVLCKGMYLLFPFALLPALMIRFGARNKTVIGSWVIVVVTMVGLLSPWVARNYILSGEFIPVTTHGGIVFYYGNQVIEHYSLNENTPGQLPDQEHARLYGQIRDSIRSRNPSFSHAWVEAQVDKILLRMALNDIVEQPLKFMEKILKGLAFVWYLGDTGLKSTALLLMQGPLVFSSILGMFYAVRAKRHVLPLLTILCYFVVIQTAFLSLGRFSYPMVPILVAFAAYAIDTVWSKYRRRPVNALE
jgi:4-amino-4-deoxy-L-arabinose transferase-like glycosyltransferase